jgi:cytochrome c oxidase subunit IV
VIIDERGERFVETKKKEAYRQIFMIFLILAVFTGVEYVVSQMLDSIILLFLIALVKAGLIINYFMHVYRLWREESH